LASSSFSRLSRNSFACWSRAVCFSTVAFFARFAVGSARTVLCAWGGAGEDGADFGARFASRSLPADSGGGGNGSISQGLEASAFGLQRLILMLCVPGSGRFSFCGLDDTGFACVLRLA
jgi:hypothetical protein